MNQKRIEKKQKLFYRLIGICAFFSIMQFLPISFPGTLRAMPEKINSLEEIPNTRIPQGRFTINYHRFFFIDKKTGWLTARDRMGRTFNGGKTWEIKRLGLLGEPTKALFFLNKDLGWYADFDRVLRTLDGGKSWKEMKRATNPDEGIPDTFLFEKDLYFINENKGWGITVAELYQTEDAGLKWTKIYQIPGKNGHLNGINFVDPNQGWIGGTIAGPTAFVLSTIDGGKTWGRTDLGEGAIEYLTFLDAKIGWAVGWKNRPSDKDKIPGSDGLIFRTTDGGKTWEQGQLPPETSMPINYIYMKDRQKGWAAGGWYIFHTLDGGATWKTIATNTNKKEGKFIYVALVEQDKRQVLLIGSSEAIYRMFLE